MSLLKKWTVPVQQVPFPRQIGIGARYLSPFSTGFGGSVNFRLRHPGAGWSAPGHLLFIIPHVQSLRQETFRADFYFSAQISIFLWNETRIQPRPADSAQRLSRFKSLWKKRTVPSQQAISAEVGEVGATQFNAGSAPAALRHRGRPNALLKTRPRNLQFKYLATTSGGSCLYHPICPGLLGGTFHFGFIPRQAPISR
jgi:hypothetical protein